MAGSINKVILVGNLGKDPEVRMTQEGVKVVIFNERIADVADKYLRKGSKVYIEGQLQTRKWTDQEGKERYTTEVVVPRFRGELTMLDSARSTGMDAESPTIAPSNNSAREASTSIEHLDDEVPF